MFCSKVNTSGSGSGFSSSEDKDISTYLDTGGEQTIYESLSTDRREINGIWFDMSNMTQNGTFRAYYKVDGTNYTLALEDEWKTTQEPGCHFAIDYGVTDDFKITWEEDADTGGDIDIPYVATIETLE